MSHGKLRESKICLNCGSRVEERFCPECGQENSETRKPFHYLFTHFVEDFTHYDGQFWGTIKNLLFKPGKLTNIYVEGKRQRFVPPVKLYIFISFITFFLFALFPPYTVDWGENAASKEKNISVVNKVATTELQKTLDTLQSKRNLSSSDSLNIEKLSASLEDSAFSKGFISVLGVDKGIAEDIPYRGYKTKKSYDSANLINPSIFNFIDKPIAHKFFELKEKGAKKGEIYKSLAETAYHNLPKALFLYLPVFAFFLWLFHNKKKWWYFEHGVFTLHYFSFLLLIILLFAFLSKIVKLSDLDFLNAVLRILMGGILIYSFLYFFIAHHRVYHNHSVISIIKGSILFMLNFFVFLFFVLGLGILSFLMIH